jgi:plasmid stabilization system protein ParE
MAYKLIWSPASRDDLHDIISFISRDSPRRVNHERELVEIARLWHAARGTPKL